MLIGEVAKKAGVTRDTVRFYERSGLISSGERQAGTRIYNVYAPEVVKTLEFIKNAQSCGFTLREIKGVLDEWGTDIESHPRAELIHKMESKLAQIDEKLGELQKVRGFVCAKLERLKRAARPD